MKFSSFNPYLLKAFYEWLIANKLTPYLIVDIIVEGVKVPMQYAKKDKTIILNLGTLAVNRLSFNNEIISFQTRFNSILYSIIIPISAKKII
ncbi:MAG: ClpXP protease specificity-enhancing factor SspB [Candidatus Dasytiphilus stammeri]